MLRGYTSTAFNTGTEGADVVSPQGVRLSLSAVWVGLSVGLYSLYRRLGAKTSRQVSCVNSARVLACIAGKDLERSWPHPR